MGLPKQCPDKHYGLTYKWLSNKILGLLIRYQRLGFQEIPTNHKEALWRRRKDQMFECCSTVTLGVCRVHQYPLKE